MHLPDGEYNIKLNDDRVVKLKFETIVPKRYDERIGYRCLTEDDLTNVSKVVIHNQEVLNKEGIRNRPIYVNEIWNVKEFCRISHFVYNNGKSIDPDFENNIPTGEMIYLNAEVDRDRLGRLRYTRVTLLSEDEQVEERAISAINKLVDAYRIVSEEYWLNRINERDILFTSTQSGGDYAFSYRWAVKARPSIDQEKVNLLKDLLSNNEPLPTFHMLLLDARRALDEENYSLVVILSITSLESVVKQFIGNLPEGDFGDNSSHKKKNLFTMVTVVLRSILDKDEFPDEIIQAFKESNNLRNKIVHEAKTNVGKDDAEKAFKTASKMVSVILPKLDEFH